MTLHVLPSARVTAPANTLPVSETFSSIQGEGKLSGVPSFFIRTSGCNLRCTWCDTPYASWAPESQLRSLESLVAEVTGSGLRHVVLTGGEPLLHAAAVPLMERLTELGHHLTVETAGTIFRRFPCNLLSLSPKLSNSTPSDSDARDPSRSWPSKHEARRINIVTLQQLIDHFPDKQLKFVVRTRADLCEITHLLGRLQGILREDVMLMPEGTSPLAPSEVAWMVSACLGNGWRFCDRLHLRLFSNRRGT